MKKIIVVGGGGHGKVLVYTLKALKHNVFGIVDSRFGGEVGGIKVLGNDSWLFEQDPKEFILVNGIGSVSFPEVRRKIFETYKDKNFSFMTVIHPTAFVDPSAVLGEGTQVLAGAIVQPEVKIGENVILNTGSIIEHDCVVGSHSHIAPGATLSGSVHIGNTSHIGVSATVIQGMQIGDYSLVAAGAVVTAHMESNSRVAGVPAKSF
jgi:UDP-perosamine 4-acetyltransferase